MMNLIFHFSKENAFSLNFDYLEEIYWSAGQKLSPFICDIREGILKILIALKLLLQSLGKPIG